MKIVVIGGTAAGTSAAAKAKRINKNAEITIFEKSSYVSFGACGLPYFIGDFFDDTKEMFSRSLNQYNEQGIMVKINSEVLDVDPELKTITVKDQTEEFTKKFDRLVIASGSVPNKPQTENCKLKNIFTLKNVEDGIAIKKLVNCKDIKNIVIVGAGFIGLELADVLMCKNKNVTIIDQASSILSNVLDNEISEILKKTLDNSGVNIVLNEKILNFKGESIVKGVTTDKNEYKADLVIVAIGVKPNTYFLKNSKILMQKGAILTNKFLQTNYEYIYAAGDCAMVYDRLTKGYVYSPLATTANKTGRIAGENVAGGRKEYPGSLTASALLFNGLGIASVGLNEQRAKNNSINYATNFISDKVPSNYYIKQNNIYGKIIYNKDSGVLLGAQFIGPGEASAMRANILSTAIYAGLTVDDLGYIDLNYAPPFSKVWDIVNTIGNTAKKESH